MRHRSSEELWTSSRVPPQSVPNAARTPIPTGDPVPGEPLRVDVELAQSAAVSASPSAEPGSAMVCRCFRANTGAKGRPRRTRSRQSCRRLAEKIGGPFPHSGREVPGIHCRFDARFGVTRRSARRLIAMTMRQLGCRADGHILRGVGRRAVPLDHAMVSMI